MNSQQRPRFHSWHWLTAPVALGCLTVTTFIAPAQAQQTSLTVPANPSQIGVYGSASVDAAVYPTPRLLEIQNPNQPLRRDFVIEPRRQNVGGELNSGFQFQPIIQVIRVQSGFLNQETANVVNFSF